MIMKNDSTAPGALKSILPASQTRPKPQLDWTSPSTKFLQFLGGNFSFTTQLLIGACLQTMLTLIFRGHRYILLASFLVILFRIANAFLIHYRVIQNPYLKESLQHRYTALVPNEDGEIEGPADQKIAIVLLGAKSNHPFGFFAPQFMKIGEYFQKMTDSLAAGNHKGFLGHTSFNRLDERGAMETVLIGYWRSIEDVHEFAFSPVHKEGWQWWEKTLKENDYVGINHEIFEADKQHWESVYANFQPTGLAATSYLRKADSDTFEGGVVSDEWISPIVDASRGKLAKSSARLGRQAIKFDANRPYAERYD